MMSEQGWARYLTIFVAKNEIRQEVTPPFVYFSKREVDSAARYFVKEDGKCYQKEPKMN